MKKIIAGLSTALLAFGFAVVAGIAPASAQTPTVSGSAVCQTDGTYTVTWTYSVSDVPEGVTATASVATSSPASTITGGGTTSTGTSFTQSGISGTATEAAVTVNTVWSDGVTESTSATLALGAGCAAPAPVAETPPVETPTVATPVVETPVVAAPVAESPTVEAPVVEAPATDAPADPEPVVSTDATTAARGPAPCVADPEVSYDYDSATNSGTITVGLSDQARGASTVLCEPIYVAATSWNFLSDDDVWPVGLNVVDEIPVITEVGTFAFGTPVSCGKGIIYASYDEIEIPFDVLEGYETPQETWLEDLFYGNAPSYTYNYDDCVEQVGGEATASPQICDPEDPFSPLSGQIEFALNDNVTYAVDGVEVSGEAIDVEPGTYTVTATAAEGYELIGESEWVLTVDPADCELPVFAVWDANASAVSEQCPPSNTTPVSGYIEVVFPEGAENAVQYFLGDTELTAARTNVDPGTYTVTAVPRNPEDSILGDTSWTLTVGSAECALPTLALTGTDSGSGLAIGAGLLMLGGTLLLMRRPRIQK